ncbi:hypothetical protein [Candidatus Methylacidithermus pantelleriae]|uniref:Uncharacterized protein n=1 Tax=Candidatus Methylacidithermus pantelleriae TaxID=2744239 RepID=A0A8J2FWQ0_9BACT|nr:hypothetical protein [Candidatus Methylacidithermus pantelleriae]CAF0700605.1 hypothetical protein MPNT_390002 [Candidatus Methylacidithermus pantelleriae]
MLFSFAYRQGDREGLSRLFSIGVEVTEVDPAYTSVIDAVNHARPYGASFYHCAASCRRLERVSALQTRVGARGSRVTFALPGSNRTKDVWSFL